MRLRKGRVRRKALLRESGQQAFTLTDAERVMFTMLRDRLLEHGATMTDAVEFFFAACAATRRSHAVAVRWI